MTSASRVTSKKKFQRRVQKKSDKAFFDKYELYSKAVQSPDTDVVFIRKVYKELRKKEPRSLREDFCGTFALSKEWIKLNPRFEAFGVDFDPEPLEYGKAKYLAKLKDTQKRRLHLMEQNVLSGILPTVDIAIAMNFSYFVFKTREIMKQYFVQSFKSLKSNGIFIIDCFGGSACGEPNEEKTDHKNFSYYWDQESFDPVTSRAVFHIHFKLKRMPKAERVFTYDWRMWTIPELREMLHAAGFKKTHVYWEGTTKAGEGDGVFTRTEKGEACQSWIAYIAAEK